MMCFFGHKWTKWEQYNEKRFSVINDKTYGYALPRQKRHCEKCGYVQDKTIKGD
jgi:hypothetical protein